MKQFITKVLPMAVLVMSTLVVSAQQLPDPGFEDWSGGQFSGEDQLKNWHASNVEQVGMTFNFEHREKGRSGNYCVMVQDQSVGAMGITENAPGYVSLGQPWQYLPSITQVSKATAGTAGGIKFTHRPDSMVVWIKRTGDNWSKEDFHLLFYSWKGTTKGTKYKNKNNACTDYERTNEESDIRQALDGNECGTDTKGTQIAEGWWRERKEYGNWTRISVPIFYMSDEVPEMCNVIFSASNYPNFRANSGLYVGNSLYVDDVTLVYSSQIQQLYIGGKEWKGFNPNSSEEQVYSVGRTTTVPEIYAVRGVGSLTNPRNTTVNFPGRRLSGDEISIKYGKVDGEATVITVKSGDGKSTTTYKIKMIQAPSDNAKLGDILVNGTSISGFNPMVGVYNVALPYGTTKAPVVSYVMAEDGQTVTVTQATSAKGTATINVTAPDGTTTKTYTINFSVAQLADNTLEGIKINGELLANFVPTLTTYSVELPLGTTKMPTVEAVSAYPAGEQTIVYTAPDKIDGGQYKISVTTPGNQTAKVYKLNFKITASTNCKLRDLKMGDYILFNPDSRTYYVTLPIGTTTLPEITYVKGDAYQKVEIKEGGVDGTTSITVTAASGDQMIYKIICSTEKSEASHLNNIYIGGVALEGFDPNVTAYTYNLPIGTTELPTITWDKGDDYETVTLTAGSLNGMTRITVTAGNGNTTIYKITFSLETSSNATLKGISVGGEPLTDFDPATLIYLINLPKGTTELPAITWTQYDEWQTVTVRYGGVNGDTKITVRPQTGAPQTYTLQFRVETSSVNYLEMITLDGKPLAGFHKDTLNYIDSLPIGVSTIPAIGYVAPADVKYVKVLNAGNVRTIRVIAEDGAQRDYVITFIITKLESAFPKMIYVDGEPLPGFDKNVLNYIYDFEGETAPIITVDKDGDQQITIITPVLEGTAQVIVKPQGATDGNTYTILFRLKISEEVMLRDILLNGEPYASFVPGQLDYALTYSDLIPTVSYVAKEGQNVSLLQEKNIVRLVVKNGLKSATYTLTFDKQFSSDNTLSSILLDGKPMLEYKSTTYDYQLSLPAGSTLPEITYIKHHDAQVVYMGQTGASVFAINVIAENGKMATYTIDFTIEPYTSTRLLSIELDGKPLTLEEGVYTYTQQLYEGADLPELTYTKDNGQTVLALNTSDAQQQIIVKAENGETATYTINYNVVRSGDALLSNILLNDKPLAGFDSQTYNYTYEMPWRSTVVPVIQPVSATPGQTITIEYGAINATTHIHVVSADGAATTDYYIDFPVRLSNNTKLASVDIEDVDFDFSPETNNYTVTLPYQTTAVPMISYSQQEPEQHVDFISEPLSGTTRIIVTAENGDQRTYTFKFEVLDSDKANVLRSLIVTTDVQAEFTRELAENESYITINLPYGTTEFKLNYVKNYQEQTVLMQPGGIFNPTTITVKSNRPNEEDKIYTIVPNIEEQNPAVLDDIILTIDDVDRSLPGFSQNRFSYVVKVANAPTVMPVAGEGVYATPIIVNDKHWQCRVIKGVYVNTYDVWFFYPSDVVPNAEFNEWTEAANNGAPKPASWNCLADYFTSSDVLGDGVRITSGTHTFGAHDEVKEITVSGSNKAVQLNSNKSNGNAISGTWGGPLGGILPAWITLGTISGSLQEAGGSSFYAHGGIQFRNSPDVMLVRAQTGDQSNGANRIVYQLSGTGYADVAYSTDANTDFKEYKFDLKPANATVYVPQTLNIILNSFHKESMSTTTQASVASASMTIDYIRFKYNSSLAKIKVNGEEATLSGKKFTYTLPSSEDTRIPELTFVGEVDDQAQIVKWNKEDASGVRTAVIKNFAEDSTSTSYQLEVRRPLSQINTLSSLEVDGVELDDWDPEKTDYVVPVPFGQKRIGDVRAVHGSNLQTVNVISSGSTVIIRVTSETKETKTYTVAFEEQKASDVTLAGLQVADVAYDKTLENGKHLVKVYNVYTDKLPEIRYYKESDGQTVIQEGGQLFITAEDGVTKDTITIQNIVLPIPTTGKLSELLLDGNNMEGFNPNVLTYTKSKPNTTAFVREYETDAVTQIITPDSITWLVKGTEQNTYSLVYPTEKSDEIAIAGILVNGEPLSDFNIAETEYTIRSNEAVSIEIVPQKGQKLSVDLKVETLAGTSARTAAMQKAGLRYTIQVTAEDGRTQAQYSIDVLPELSSDASLRMIQLNGANLAGFTPDKHEYAVVLPTENPKVVEPTMPSITYVAGHSAQTITVDTAHIGGTSYINVTSQDGYEMAVYELLITTEPSHNAELNGLMINGKPLTNFRPDRHYYSAIVEDLDVQVGYSSLDYFQRVESTVTGDTVTVSVVAQDSVTVNQYIIELLVQSLSSDVMLSGILLDGKTFTDYDPSIIPFSPMNSHYTIPVPVGQRYPDVEAVEHSVGQTTETITQGDSALIIVTAEDGKHTNAYVLYFKPVYSTNTDLAKLAVGDSLLTLIPGKTEYQFVLPVGEKTPRIVEFTLANDTIQEYDNEQTDGLVWSVEVIAQDKSVRTTYSIQFILTKSTYSQLSDISVNEQTIAGFRPDSTEYSFTLPMGEREVPVPTFEKGDEWQFDPIVKTTTTAYRTVYECTVLAEDSITRSVYTLTFDIQPSDVDTLQSISIVTESGVRQLDDFRGDSLNYTFDLPKGTTEFPAVELELGDMYQDTLVSLVGNVYSATVIAENGNKRTYTVTFIIARDDDATLREISCAGRPLDGFDPETFDYTVTLPYGTTDIPFVSYVKNSPLQQDQMTVQDNQVSITVTAEDGTISVYTITFITSLSPEARLATITLDGEPIADFSADLFEYTITLPYGTTTMPEVNATLLDTTAVVELTVGEHAVVISTTAADGEHYLEYVVNFVIERCNINWLSDLMVGGTTIEGFDKDSLYYILEYPVGTDSTAFVKADDITWTLADTTETVTLVGTQTEIQIVVTAQNNDVRVYVISQVILISSNSLLSDLAVNGSTLRGFNDSIFEYSYIVIEGEIPTVEALPQDSLAEVSVTQSTDGDVLVYCTAPDGSESVYVIHFIPSTIQESLEPTAQDVLFKQLPGTDQFAIYTIRMNTWFALYDHSGHIYMNLMLPLSNPNDIEVATDSSGREILTDCRGTGTVFTIPAHGQTFFYLFYTDNKRLQTGKIMVK